MAAIRGRTRAIGSPTGARMMQYHADLHSAAGGFRLGFGLPLLVQLDRTGENMPAILNGFLGIWRRYFPTAAAVLSLASTIGAACNVAAEEPKHIRITLARSVSAIPLWGIGPFAENAGFRGEDIPPVQMPTFSANCRAASSSAYWAIKAQQAWPSKTLRTSRSSRESNWAVRISSCAKGLTSNRGRTSKENALADRQEAT